MSIKYSYTKRKILSGKDKGKEQSYLVARHSYICDMDQIAKLISLQSRIHEIDVKRVFLELQVVLKRELEAGALVRLGGLGSFCLVIRSKGCDANERFNRKNINRIKIQFQPGRNLTIQKEQLEFRYCPKLLVLPEEEDTDR